MPFDPTSFVADPELVEALQQLSTPLDCEPGRVLFEQGEMAVGLYLLVEGRVTLTVYAKGRAVASAETGPGALLGLQAMIGDQLYSMTAVAHPRAEVRFIDRESFSALIQSDARLALKALEVLAAQVRNARSALS